MSKLNEDDVEANRGLLLAVGSDLLPTGEGGGSVGIVGEPFRLVSRHKVMKLGDDDSSHVHVVQVKGKPLMVLTALLVGPAVLPRFYPLLHDYAALPGMDLFVSKSVWAKLVEHPVMSLQQMLAESEKVIRWSQSQGGCSGSVGCAVSALS